MADTLLARRSSPSASRTTGSAKSKCGGWTATALRIGIDFTGRAAYIGRGSTLLTDTRTDEPTPVPLLNERATSALDQASAQRLTVALQTEANAARGRRVKAAPAEAPNRDATTPPPPARTTEPRRAKGTAAPTIMVDDRTLPVTPEVVEAVLDLLRRFAEGHAVVVASTDSLLTTSQAAELIGISATYLLRLANEGVIPVEYRGTHRRFALADATAYLEKSRAAKAERAASSPSAPDATSDLDATAEAKSPADPKTPGTRSKRARTAG
ncbi:helix-turn-helix domain-containing protein [Subtercola frigoramans]|uniref:Excisionase family DNA binding protein n=1 Tax=Subtercola frigoramans TaxID=120298 RepID=A0ABS2L063_9MICO|nr:helix-turn-helix domain-containing protein [Subtercola frigoramans]MBM7470439.1 excisionase family DNA binding protein [Subtercola frigoramans]